MAQQKFLLVGQIIKPHGIRGELGVKSLTERPDLRFRPEAPLFLGPDENNLQRVVLSSVRPYKQGYLVRFKSFEDRNAVEPMRGWFLYVETKEVPELEQGRYYHHQLIGLEVEDENGSRLGRVCAIIEIEPHDLLEIESPRGKFLLPMVDEFVLEVDLEAGKLRVRPPEGIMDI